MTEDEARPPADSMTSQDSCYHGNCESSPKWGISSAVEKKNPDGSPLTLLACDDHYCHLTTELRQCGTRYSIFPIGGPHMVPPMFCPTPDGEGAPDTSSHILRRVGNAFVGTLVAVIAIVIAPFVITYYGVRWICGWRPPFRLGE